MGKIKDLMIDRMNQEKEDFLREQNQKLSICCGAEIICEDICSDCKEHTEGMGYDNQLKNK